ncbi:MAG: hypothetical protein ACK4GN_14400 [Runella sp.]
MSRSFRKMLVSGGLLLLMLKVAAQTQVISLKSEKINASANGFFIIEVLDERPTTTNIGKIWSRPQPLTATLKGGAATAIEKFLERNFNPPQTDSLTPIVLIIKELNVAETLTPANRVSGEINMSLGFETYRAGKRLYLTGGKATTTYTRAGIAPEDMIEKLLRRLLENELRGFGRWFAQYAPTSDLLAREVKVVFEEISALPESDTVYYRSDRPLTWKDFMGAPSVLSRWAAQVFTSFGFEARSSVKDRTLFLYVRPKVWIDKTISWVRPESKNDYVLDHEQLHFDITRVIAERFKHKLQSMTLSVEDFSSELQYQYIEFYRLHGRLQQQYDDQTQHGLNRSQQAQWSKKIRDELRSYGITPPRP